VLGETRDDLVPLSSQQFGESGVYETPLLPGLRLDVAVLWQDKLPGYYAIGQAVREMLGQG
jgi:hypothetical protein